MKNAHHNFTGCHIWRNSLKAFLRSYSQDRGRWTDNPKTWCLRLSLVLRHTNDHVCLLQGIHVSFQDIIMLWRRQVFFVVTVVGTSHLTIFKHDSGVAVRNCGASNHTKFMWKHKIVQHHKWRALERVSVEEKTESTWQELETDRWETYRCFSYDCLWSHHCWQIKPAGLDNTPRKYWEESGCNRTITKY